MALKREFASLGRSTAIPSIAVVAAGLLLALSGVSPANMADFQSATTRIHTVGSFGCYVAFIVAGFWFPPIFRKASSWRWMAAPSLVIVFVSIVTGLLRFAGMASIGQRLTFACFFLWVALVGFALWRANPPGAPHNSSGKDFPSTPGA